MNDDLSGILVDLVDYTKNRLIPGLVIIAIVMSIVISVLNRTRRNRQP